MSRIPQAPVLAPRSVGAGFTPARDNERVATTGGGRPQGPPLRHGGRPQASVRAPLAEVSHAR